MNRCGPYGAGVSYEPRRRGFKKYRARMFRNGAVDLGRYTTAAEARLAVKQANRLLRFYRLQAAASNEQQQAVFRVPPLAYPKVLSAVQNLIAAQPHLLTEPADDDGDDGDFDAFPMGAEGPEALAAMHAAAAAAAIQDPDTAAAAGAAAAAAPYAYDGAAGVLPAGGHFAQQQQQQEEVQAAPNLGVLHAPQQGPDFAPQAAAGAAAAAAAGPEAFADPAQQEEDATLLHSFLDMLLDLDADGSDSESASAAPVPAASEDSMVSAAAAAAGAALLPAPELLALEPVPPPQLQPAAAGLAAAAADPVMFVLPPMDVVHAPPEEAAAAEDPAGAPFLGLTTRAELLQMSGSCVNFLLNLYMQLLQGMPSRHTRVLLMQWLGEARHIVMFSGLPLPMQRAIMLPLSKLVQLLIAPANVNGYVFMPLLGGLAAGAGCELVLPVVEQLLHALEQLRLLCSMEPASAGDIAQMWFAQLVQQAPLPGDYVVQQLVQLLLAA